MSRELCACFVDDDCVLLYLKQARVVDSMLYKDKTEHCLINHGAHLSLNILWSQINNATGTYYQRVIFRVIYRHS